MLPWFQRLFSIVRSTPKTKKYIYEVKWMHKPVESNTWVERDTLLEMGYSKIVNKKDEQEAAAAGLLSKPLTAPGVEQALKDFGLDSESASHMPLASLSQSEWIKVYLTMAACNALLARTNDALFYLVMHARYGSQLEGHSFVRRCFESDKTSAE